MNYRFFIIMAAFLTASVSLFAQGERKDKTAVTYEEIYDEPYSVNKLFVGLQPLYAELFATNVNAGFGIEAAYYHLDKLDFKASFRKTYTQQFFDFARDLADKQSSMDNRAQAFIYFELGGTYHIKDFEESSKTKMFLYKNSYKGNKWAARVPLSAEVPCKVRKIYGIRLGGIAWSSSTDLDRTLTEQGLTNSDLKNVDNAEVSLPLQEYNKKGELQDVHTFTNVYSKGLYVGGSMTWIKNVAVNFDKFEEGIDDGIFTAFFDILVTPSLELDNLVYTPKTAPGDPLGPGAPLNDLRATYSVSPVKTKMIGWRLGIDGRFNRGLSWSYGGEVGYKPTLAGMGFYALMKISFPVFGTNLDYKVESFGK